MKTYDKRIAFAISDQHFIPHGGVGQFCKGFTEMCKDFDWKIDILLDKAPTHKKFKELIESLGGRIVYPKKPKNYEYHDEIHKYSEHVGSFAFTDSVNLEKILNFRKCMMDAFETNLYDMMVCNTQESMSAAYVLSLTKDMPVVFYSHLHSMIFREQPPNDVFLECYHNFFNKHLEFPDIFVGTQTFLNKIELEARGSKFVSVLPMPISERDLLSPNPKDRNGVLFIGRWEDGKNPEAYIKVMKETGLSCKVMTSDTSAKTFEDEFKKAGITDYDIRVGITGEEKVNFIKTSKVFFCPSKRESYGMALYECIGHMPCVTLEDYAWPNNFESIYYFKTSLDEAGELIKLLHEQFDPKKHYKTEVLHYVQGLNELALKSWKDFLYGYTPRESNSNQARINSETTVKYKDFIADKVKGDRKYLAREDFESVLTNRYKFNVIYTDHNTYLSKDEKFTPTEEMDNDPDKGITISYE